MPGPTSEVWVLAEGDSRMNARFVEQITAALAPDRLEAYRRDGASEDLALARYLLNLALCEAVYSPLHACASSATGCSITNGSSITRIWRSGIARCFW